MFTTVSALLTRLPAFQDEEAWEIFDRRYSPMLRGFFASFGVRGEALNDLVQDTVHKAIDGLRLGSYRRDKGRLRDWMGGIAKNVLREHWRKTRRKGAPVQTRTQFWEHRVDPAGEDELRAAEERFDELWVRARLSALVRHAATCFSRRDLRCYFLVEIHKRPIAEVARRLGMSVSSVYNRRRAVARWMLAVGPRFVSRWES